MPYIVFIVSLFLSACTAPAGLMGSWRPVQKTCRLADASGVFREDMTESYLLNFTKQEFKISFFNQNMRVLRKTSSGGQEQINITNCDVDYRGSYSYSPSGKLFLDFLQEDGFYSTQTKKGCALPDTAGGVDISSIPEENFFKTVQPIEVKAVDAQALQLAFSGFPECQNEEMTVFFSKDGV